MSWSVCLLLRKQQVSWQDRFYSIQTDTGGVRVRGNDLNLLDRRESLRRGHRIGEKERERERGSPREYDQTDLLSGVLNLEAVDHILSNFIPVVLIRLAHDRQFSPR